MTQRKQNLIKEEKLKTFPRLGMFSDNYATIGVDK